MASSGKTYTCNPSGRPIDAVRLLVGETECASAKLFDAEIQFFLDSECGLYYAAAAAADALCAHFAKSVTYRVGGSSKQLAELSKNYAALAAKLRAQADQGATIYAGGQSIAEKERDALDTDRVQPTFWRGMHDDPGSTQPTPRPVSLLWAGW